MPDLAEITTLQQRLLRFSTLMSQVPAAREVIRKLWSRSEFQLQGLRGDLEREAQRWADSRHPQTDAVESAIDISILLFYGENMNARDIAALAREPVFA